MVTHAIGTATGYIDMVRATNMPADKIITVTA
jgi:hypothetical protein